MKKDAFTRREFIAGSALALAGCAVARPRTVSRVISPNEKLNIAAIGCGGKGNGNISSCESENIVALCDVDEQRAGDMFNRFPNATRYRDFRVMLEKEKNIDAVIISTPDHMHAPQALMAMRMGKHVYVEKPLTHTVLEARLLTETARRYGVATQMGNQGHSEEGVRRICEGIWGGLIGCVREAHVWTNRPVWPQNLNRPEGSDVVPDHMDWDLWLGVANPRPFKNGVYHPFAWRGWWDFGCGALGDMACHIMDPVYWALRLGEVWPSDIEVVEMDGGNEETAPAASKVKYEFPARKGMPPVTVYWYDGGKMPVSPEGIGDDVNLGSNGSLFVGDHGFISAGEYGGNPRLLPQAFFAEAVWPAPSIPRSIGHHAEWIAACKGGPPAGSNFDYAGPFTEMVLLGNVAIRTGDPVKYDGRRMRILNNREANRFLTKEYRKGWDWIVS